MSDLSQFNSVQEASLENFQIEGNDSSGVTEATAKQIAGHTAILKGSEGEVSDTYDTVYQEMLNTGNSRIKNSYSEELRRESLVREQLTLQDLILDDSVSFEEKKVMTESLLDKMNGTPRFRDQVSEEALLQDSDNENSEMETVRLNTGAIIQEVNEAKRFQESLVNGVISSSDPSTMDSLIDFAEYLVPFVESKRLQTLLSDYKGEEDLSARGSTFLETVTLLGSSKVEVIEALKKMSPADQMQASQALVDALNSSQELLLPDDNDLAKLDFVKTFLEDGYYTTVDKWVDNVIGLLDLTVLGAAISRPLRFVKTSVKATSVARNMKDVNPSKARALHSASVVDEEGKVAEAAYGSTRNEAIVDDLSFQIDDSEGLENKVGNIGADFEKQYTPDPEAMDVAESDGQIYYWEDEKRQARAIAYNDFRNPLGIRLRDEMSSVGTDVHDGVTIKSVYGPTDGGFATAQEAINTTMFTFRKYGLGEDNIELMMQRGDKYLPVPKELMESVKAGKIRPTGGFLTRVNYRYKVNPTDIEEWSKADVKWNFLDRIVPAGLEGQGSLQRHVLDAHSMLHPNLTMGAAVAVDRAAGLESNLLDLGKEFTDLYSKLPSDRKFLLDEYVREANDRGLALNLNKLRGEGYQPDEIQALTHWKNYWDTLYELENRDLGKTLRNRGFQILESKDSGARLFAKPVGKQYGVEAYDPIQDTVRRLTPEETDDLYNKGGTIGKLRDPVELDGNFAEFVISAEDTGSYLRSIREGDQILNYRNGYYSVQYTAPKFVVERVKDKSGKVRYEHAIGMAGHTKGAEEMAERLATTNGKRFDNSDPEADYFVRDNVKSMRIDSDDYWSIQVAGGRSAQRVRGKRLQDASGSQVEGEQNFVMGPVDSLIHSARNISRRTYMRDYLDSSKLRFVDQYKNVLPRDDFGKPIFPSNISEIGRMGQKTSKEAADARTTYEYITSLENGYINGIDEGYKAGLKWISNMLGGASRKTGDKLGKALSKVEEDLLKLYEAQGPTGFAKNTAFQAYLASAPLRQIVVQSHQTVLLSAVNPLYMARGGLTRDLMASVAYVTVSNMKGEAEALKFASQISGKSGREFKAMWNAWQESGMGAAVSKQNLIRGSLSEMAEYGKYGATRSTAQKVALPVTKTLEVSRIVGFDSGEYFNSYASWLTYYDKVKSSKKGEMTKTDYDRVGGLARNISLNMNQAGEMPYNQNTLSMFFQFMQVPHKMMTLMSTNRVLSVGEKAGLAAVNFTLFGVGGNLAYDFFNPILPENPELKEAVTNGLEGWMINTALTMATGEETRINFEGLAPTDMYGISDFITELWSGNAGDIISASPAGQLFFGGNPRITNAFRRLAQYTHLMEDYNDPLEFSTVVKGFAEISSGYSAYGKAKIAWNYGIKRNGYGGIIDENVSSAEAIAQLFGFNTLDERDTYLTNDILYEESKAFEDDFKLWYKDMKRNIVADGVNPEEQEFSNRIINAGLQMFEGNRPRFQRLLLQQLKYDVEQNKDYSLFRSALRANGFMDSEERTKFIEALPFENEDTKKNILNILEYRTSEENDG